MIWTTDYNATDNCLSEIFAGYSQNSTQLSLPQSAYLVPERKPMFLCRVRLRTKRRIIINQRDGAQAHPTNMYVLRVFVQALFNPTVKMMARNVTYIICS